jgi:hypothetical protein
MSQKMADYLKQHPRMTGVLFTMLLLLSQAGTALANNAGSINGP